MILGDTVRYYFQLLGVLLLTTETTWMLARIILGISCSLLSFGWDLLMLGGSLLLSRAGLVLLFWIYLVYFWRNIEIYSFVRSSCGEWIYSQFFPC